MKLQTITLKEVGTREIEGRNGEFEQVSINEKKYPIFLTNSAIKRGKIAGYIETSLIGELSKLQVLKSVSEDDLSALQSFDDTQMIQIIYLAFTAANKNVSYTFDEFFELYHYNMMETMQLYTGLISDSMGGSKNNFAAGLKDSTAPSSSKKN